MNNKIAVTMTTTRISYAKVIINDQHEASFVQQPDLIVRGAVALERAENILKKQLHQKQKGTLFIVIDVVTERCKYAMDFLKFIEMAEKIPIDKTINSTAKAKNSTIEAAKETESDA